MTPREKAHELFEKMALHICNTDAQECALIAVDEILKTLDNDDLYCDGETNINGWLNYYIKVKQELEQILENGFSRV